MPDDVKPAALTLPDFNQIKNDAYGVALRQRLNNMVAENADLAAANAVLTAAHKFSLQQIAALKEELKLSKGALDEAKGALSDAKLERAAAEVPAESPESAETLQPVG